MAQLFNTGVINHNINKGVFWYGRRWMLILADDRVKIPPGVTDNQIRHRFDWLLKCDPRLSVLTDGTREEAAEFLLQEAEALFVDINLENPSAVYGLGAGNANNGNNGNNNFMEALADIKALVETLSTEVTENILESREMLRTVVLEEIQGIRNALESNIEIIKDGLYKKIEEEKQNQKEKEGA